jgi:hypothetical protein
MFVKSRFDAKPVLWLILLLLVQGNMSLSAVNSGATDETDSFCLVLRSVIPLAEEDFKPIRGNHIGNLKFETSVHLPGARKCYISDVDLVVNYIATFGIHDDAEDAAKELEMVYQKVRGCYPDWLFYKADPPEDELLTVGFCKGYSDGGFDRRGHSVRIRKMEGYFVVELVISHPFRQVNVRINRIAASEGSGDAGFDSDLKTLIAAAPDNFKTLWGEKQTREGTFFNTSWYIPTLILSGASDSKISAFGEDHTYFANLYKGSDSLEARAAYEDLLSKLKLSLGATYCYISDIRHDKMIFAFLTDFFKEKTPVIHLGFDKEKEYYRVFFYIGYDEFGDL